MQTEGQKELEAAQNDNVAESEVDESGAVEAAEYAGITEDVEGENITPETETPKAEGCPGILGAPGQDVDVPSDEPQSETVVQEDKYAQEVPITHLKSPVNKKVFEATPDLMKRKDLVPCDEDGKKVYDHRCL